MHPILLRNDRPRGFKTSGEREGHRASLSTLGPWTSKHFQTGPCVSSVLTGRGPRSLGFKDAFDRICTGNFRRGSSCKKNVKRQMLGVISVSGTCPPLLEVCVPQQAGCLCVAVGGGGGCCSGEWRTPPPYRRPGWPSLQKDSTLPPWTWWKEESKNV